MQEKKTMAELLDALIVIMESIGKDFYTENDFLDYNYPFEKDFGEVLNDVLTWRHEYMLRLKQNEKDVQLWLNYLDYIKKWADKSETISNYAGTPYSFDEFVERQGNDD